MFRRALAALLFVLLALAATTAFAQGGGPGGPPPGGGQGPPGNLQPCAQGQLPSPQSPCILPPCQQGQQPTPDNPCFPNGPGGIPAGQTPGDFPACAQGQQPTPQSPCLPSGGPGGGGGGGGCGGGSGGGGGGCQGGGPGGGGPGGGSDLPRLSGGFLSHVWRMNADADSYDAAANVLNCTITKFLNLPKKFGQMDDSLIDTDAFVLFSPSTKVFKPNGDRVPKEEKYDTLLDNANTVRIVGKVVPPKKWQDDQDGTPTPTFRAKAVYVLS